MPIKIIPTDTEKLKISSISKFLTIIFVTLKNVVSSNNRKFLLVLRRFIGFEKIRSLIFFQIQNSLYSSLARLECFISNKKFYLFYHKMVIISQLSDSKSSPIPAHFEEELIQLEDLIGDIFNEKVKAGDRTEDEVANEMQTEILPDNLTPAPSLVPEVADEMQAETFPVNLSPVPLLGSDVADEIQAETLPENSTPVSLLVSDVADERQAETLPKNSTPVPLPVSVVADEIQAETLPGYSTPVPSPVPAHDDPCGDRFCAICIQDCIISNEEVYDNLPTPSPMTDTSTNVTPTTSKVSRKKTYKVDIGKKRLPHKENWSVVQRKKKKNEGKSFTNNAGKLIAEKKLGNPCGKKCRYKCTENFELKQRDKIFSKFGSWVIVISTGSL